MDISHLQLDGVFALCEAALPPSSCAFHKFDPSLLRSFELMGVPCKTILKTWLHKCSHVEAAMILHLVTSEKHSFSRQAVDLGEVGTDLVSL